MGSLIDGKEISKQIKEDIKQKINNEKLKNNKVPKIASILLGDDVGSIYYQNAQEKLALNLGFKFEKINLSKSSSQENLENLILKLNKDKEVDGIILLLPLPSHINEKKVTNLISPKKDIDCLSDISTGRFYKGENCFMPCTPNSVITLLKKSNICLEGVEVVIIGRSNIVGKPLFQMFLNENSTVTLCHSKSKKLKEITQRADILVVAIGKPKFITKDYVKDGAVVIDIGTSNLNGKIVGDVDFDDVLKKVSKITPVPGGVGALTTTLLLKNACEGLD